MLLQTALKSWSGYFTQRFFLHLRWCLLKQGFNNTCKHLVIQRSCYRPRQRYSDDITDTPGALNLIKCVKVKTRHWHSNCEEKTYVKSWRMTRAGLNGTSTVWNCVCFQFRMLSTSERFTRNSSQFLTADSRRTRMENGRRSKERMCKWILLGGVHQQDASH